MLAYTKNWRENSKWNSASQDIYDLLENDSPLSTKLIKKHTSLIGKDFNAEYERAMRFLFQRLLIVSFGEAEDGAFPSSAIGASNLLFEDLWRQSAKIKPKQAEVIIDHYMPKGSMTRKFLDAMMTK